MTNEERRALAKKWDYLPPNDEWWVIYRAYQQLVFEQAIPQGRPILTFLQGIVFMNEQPDDFALFDRLVRRVLENKLLGETE